MKPSKKPHIFKRGAWWYCGWSGNSGRVINGCASGRTPLKAYLILMAYPA
jgi:hypothetical protein